MHTLFGTYCFLYKIKKKLTFTYTLFRKFTDFRTHFSNLLFFARMKTSLNKAQFPSTVAQECCNPATLLYYSFSFAKLWSKTKGKPIVLIASFPIPDFRDMEQLFCLQAPTPPQQDKGKDKGAMLDHLAPHPVIVNNHTYLCALSFIDRTLTMTVRCHPSLPIYTRTSIPVPVVIGHLHSTYTVRKVLAND